MNWLERLLHPERFDDLLAKVARLEAENDELRADGTGGMPWADVEALVALRVTSVLDRLDQPARRYAQEQAPQLRGPRGTQERARAGGMRAVGTAWKEAIAEERALLAPRGDEAA